MSTAGWCSQIFGGHAFFFFFSAFHSPDYESAEFREFCAACYRAHSFKPSLSLAGLHAVLTVAAAREPVGYDALAARLDQSYATTSTMAGALSDGRGRRPGLKLLRRVSGEDRKQKKLEASRTGYALARLFVKTAISKAVFENKGAVDEKYILSDQLYSRILPSLRLALNVASDIQLSTFCVLLYVCQNQEKFGYQGEHSSVIAQKLGLSNLSRSLDRLAEGYAGYLGYKLLELHKKSTDRRVTLPSLSDAGARLMSDIAAQLRQKPPSVVLKPKPESLHRAKGPSEIKDFDDGDFDNIEWH